MPSNDPKIRRADALPAIVGVLVFSAMIVMACEGFVRCETPILSEYELPAIAEVFFRVQPFHWSLFLACLLWGLWLLTSSEVRLRDTFLLVGVTGNLAALWLAWGLVILFSMHNENVQRLIDHAPFL